jgi:hypothetical protein
MSEEKKEKTKVYHLKIAKKHPKDAFRISDGKQDVVVKSYAYAPHHITKKMFEQLESDPGVCTWIKCKEIEDEKVPVQESAPTNPEASQGSTVDAESQNSDPA